MNKKNSLISAAILLFLTLFYLYVDYYAWFPKQTITIPDGDGGGIIGDIVSGHIRDNKIYDYLGHFAQLFFFTVQTFYFLVIVLIIHAYNKSSSTKLWINFGKAYAGLVAILFMLMILPTIPIDQLPYVFAVETFFHLVIPGLYLYMTRNVDFEMNKDNLYKFMIIPVAYYVLNWMLHLFSGFNAWTYPFFNFTNPLSAELSLHLRIIINVSTVTLLLVVFVMTWRVYEKMYAKKKRKKAQ